MQTVMWLNSRILSSYILIFQLCLWHTDLTVDRFFSFQGWLNLAKAKKPPISIAGLRIDHRGWIED